MDNIKFPGADSALQQPQSTDFITGSGIRADYDKSAGTLTLYRLNGGGAVQMSRPSAMGYAVIGEQAVGDFIHVSCVVQREISGLMGRGERMIITSKSAGSGLTRIYTIETSEAQNGVLYTRTAYRADSGDVLVSGFEENIFELCERSESVWSYNGGGECPANSDTIRKIDLTDTVLSAWENVHDYSAACIPLADIYAAGGGIAVGDASATRREVHTPVRETANSAQISIKWPGKSIPSGEERAVGQSFVTVHNGDYYSGLRGYKNAMECLGMKMLTDVSERSFEPRWESWGWGFNWTIELILGKLDELEGVGVKQITLDDGWYDSAGDWGLKPEKFPNGISDMLRLTDAIHAHGMSALLWWRPCDGGRGNTLHREHPEYFVMNEDKSLARLRVSGKTESTYQDTSVMGYALCPGSEGAIASQIDFINRAMNDWGFDGFKQDYVWSMPKCYNPDHHHPYPEDSTERQAEFYRTAREAMTANDPDCFNLLCNCGFPQDYYSLRYMTQVITADPTTVDQTRRRAKAYKALMGDCFPICTDHNHAWYPSTIGTGSVMTERKPLIGSALKSYRRWMKLAAETQLHHGRFVGDLYSYGFDPYETYAVEKDGVMHYAFYRDGEKYKPEGSPALELRGLQSGKLYRAVDYANNRVVATNLKGESAVFEYEFATELLVKAVELAVPDDEAIVVSPKTVAAEAPEPVYETVDALSERIAYSGNWQTEQNPQFLGGQAQFTSEPGSEAILVFTGTAVRWYGQTSMLDYATADMHLDGVQLEATFTYAVPAFGKLLFELTGLDAGEHTLRITNTSGRMSIERLACATEV